MDLRWLFAETVLENSDALALVLDPEGRVVLFNGACERLTGHPREDVLGKKACGFLIPEEEGEEVEGIIRRALSGEFPTRHEHHLLTRSGERKLISWSTTAILEGGSPRYVACTGIDITERREIEGRLRAARDRIEALHRVALRIVASHDEDEVCRLTVGAAEEILGMAFCTLDLVEGDRLVVKATSSRLPEGASRPFPLSEDSVATRTLKERRPFLIEDLSAHPEARPPAGGYRSGISVPIGEIGVFQAISLEPEAFGEDDLRFLELLLGYTEQAIRRIRLERRLREQAIRDPLTGLYNRRYLEQVMEKETERARRYGHPLAFLMIDIDRFKEINDRFGHRVGDEVLRAVASLLKGDLRKADIAVRYGGDEFLVVLPEIDGEAEAVARRLKLSLIHI